MRHTPYHLDRVRRESKYALRQSAKLPRGKLESFGATTNHVNGLFIFEKIGLPVGLDCTRWYDPLISRLMISFSQNSVVL